MPSYIFPGYPAFLDTAAAELGHPEASGPARRIATFTSLANLCAQAAHGDRAHVEGILVKAAELRDQLATALKAAELMMADVEAGRREPLIPLIETSPPVESAIRATFFVHDSGGSQRPRELARTIMIVYATDEDIALRASADFSALCPRDQLLASGLDGFFMISDLWTLASASVDFNAFGLVPGLVVRLTKPSTVYGANGELFAIQAVTPGAITLRRKGQAAGVGQPPSPPIGLSGVEFAVRSLGPQIQLASYDLDRRFGIDDAIAGRRSVNLHDPQQLREAVVLTVLYKQYLDQSRQFAGPIADQAGTPGDVYSAKARIVKAELDEVLDRLALKWNEVDAAARSIATTRFSTRISR